MADGYVIGQEVYNGRPTWHGKNVVVCVLYKNFRFYMPKTISRCPLSTKKKKKKKNGQYSISVRDMW